MLVNVEATRLVDNRPVMDLINLVHNRGSSLRLSGSSTDVSNIIMHATDALLTFNNKLSRRDIETVYIELTDCMAIGVIVKNNGNLLGCWDNDNDHVFQFHIDGTMAIFAHRKRTVRKTTYSQEVKVLIPNIQAYKDLYFSPHQFHEYLNSRFNPGTELNRITLIDYVKANVRPTASIVKGKGKMSTKEADLLREFIWNYGRLLNYFRQGETPEKYVISEKWFKEAQYKLDSNPYFIFRHVWRCYFKLVCEGHLI